MKKVKLNKIPSVFKNANLAQEVYISDSIPAEEGVFVVVRALENEGKKDTLDFASGRLGKLVEGDIIPGVLGFRSAPVEFAGVVPQQVKAGDELYLLCESGLFGGISGVYEAWGQPMKGKVLGAIVDQNGKALNLSQYALPEAKKSNRKIPIIAFLATRMDTGKTIMACKIIHHLKLRGKKIAALKPTGVAFSQDPYKFRECGASPVLDFVDMGLPSTCGKSGKKVVEATENLINHLKITNPDLIVMEFGDGVIGEYHVADILQYKPIKDQISFLTLAANDFSGVFGARETLKPYGLGIDLVTGPIANSQLGVDLIMKYFQLEAESNQYGISKTLSLIEEKIFWGKA